MVTAQQKKVNLAGAYAAFQRQQQKAGTLLPKTIEYQAPGRIRQLDTLLHLSHFSDYLVLVTAPLGGGKTQFADQFLRVQPTDTCVVHLRPEEALSGPRLVREMVSQLPVDVPKHASLEQSIIVLQDLCVALAESDQVLLLVLDDAQLLEDDALELLANVIPHSSPADARLHVVLLAEPQLMARFDAPQFKELRQERYYQLNLAPFSQADSRAFLRQLVASVGLPGDADIHENQLDQVHEMAAGMPGYLDMLMRQALRQGGLRKTSNGLPVWHLVAIALGLMALLGLWLNNREIQESEFQVAEGMVTDMIESTVPGQALDQASIVENTLEPTPVSQPSLQPLPPLQPVTLSPDPEYKPLPSIAAELAAEPVDIPTAEGLVDAEQRRQTDQLLERSEALQQKLQAAVTDMKQPSKVSTPAAPEVPQTREDNAKTVKAALSSVEQQFMKLSPEHYSLQVLGARYEATTRQFVRRLSGLPLPLYVLQLQRGGEPWYVVLVGDFANRGEAREAMSSLPVAVKNLQPWVRQVTRLQQQLANKINASDE